MTDAKLLRELNRDVWHAFRRAYAARDTDGFLALHIPDLIRAGGPGKQVNDFGEYAAQTRQWFDELTTNGISSGIEFRFVERLASGDLASERGVYRISATRVGDERVFYGRFHTFSRKVGGRWRIAVDYDSDEDGTVTEESFTAGREIDDVASFVG